MEQDYWN
jgi:hypothetical protein